MPVGPGAGRKWTYDDLVRLPDDGKRHEIIDGEHFVMSSPLRRHQAVLGRLYLASGNFLAGRPDLGQVYLAPFDVVFSRYDVVQPDLVFIAADQLEILTEKNVQGSPALVVEILSDGTRRHDEQTKRRLYARCDVREYWIVDVRHDKVTIYRRVASRMLCRAVTLGVGRAATLTTPLLPGLAVPIDDLLAR
jgi:Uma2 family endonuclease